MDIGIGLPATVPGTTGGRLTEWARLAERRGFATLAVLDRLVYGNYEPLVTLAAAAAVTERVRLAATVLLAGYRGNTALLAKQLASVDLLSGGRVVAGVAAGGRPDDFTVSGTTYTDRGRRLDELIDGLRAHFGGAVGPAPAQARIPILVGGHSPAAMRRAARLGDGWIAGGSSALPYAELASRARAEWTAAGRTDPQRMVALAYYALGPDAQERAASYVGTYYAQAGPYAKKVLATTATTEESVAKAIEEHREAGCDELLFFPCGNALGQVDRLAELACVGA
jgi:alkanesulfonate monooxygenase SsuD/methylene tetrahydromethanopterin reductase-like flavin-dependent oxidoreductase (luciferase family)